MKKTYKINSIKTSKKTKMKAVIIGGGVVGSSIASQLSLDGHDVVIVDKNPDTIKEINETMDVLAICGNAALPSVMHKTCIYQADILIAVSLSDEVNVICGIFASKYNVEKIIVRVRNKEWIQHEYGLSLQDIGIHHVVYPESSIANSLTYMIEIPGAYDITSFADGKIQIFGFRISKDSRAVGKSILELKSKSDSHSFLILSVIRNNNFMIPQDDYVIQEGDSIHVVVSTDSIHKILSLIQPKHYHLRNVIILGSSKIALTVAMELENRVHRLILIESDVKRAEEVSEILNKAMVLHGDAMDFNVLEEASVQDCDLFCALSEDGKRNMLSTLLAKKHGAKNTAVLVYEPEYASVLSDLGVHLAIEPRLVIINEIMGRIREKNVYPITCLNEKKNEIIEIEVLDNSPILDIPLKSLSIPYEALIATIIRKSGMIIPDGDTCIELGDKVLIYLNSKYKSDVEELFVPKNDYI